MALLQDNKFAKTDKIVSEEVPSKGPYTAIRDTHYDEKGKILGYKNYAIIQGQKLPMYQHWIQYPNYSEKYDKDGNILISRTKSESEDVSAYELHVKKNHIHYGKNCNSNQAPLGVEFLLEKVDGAYIKKYFAHTEDDFEWILEKTLKRYQ